MFPLSKNGKLRILAGATPQARFLVPKYRACVGTARIGASMPRQNPTTVLFYVLPGLPPKSGIQLITENVVD
jgi:hypothetical protein